MKFIDLRNFLTISLLFSYSMCRHVIKECPLSDLKCLNEPKVINHFCFTLNSNTSIPKSGQLELYFGAFLTSKVKDEFILQVKDVKAPTGVAPATRDNFHLREAEGNLQVVSLIKSVQGPQEIEINLIKKTFRNGAFHLHSKSKLFIFVSEL